MNTILITQILLTYTSNEVESDPGAGVPKKDFKEEAPEARHISHLSQNYIF